MTSTYQLVPYLLTVTVKGKPDESRPVDDIDGAGTHLQDALLRIFDGLRGRAELVDASNPERKLRLEGLRSGTSVVFVELQPGRSGIYSDIERAPRDGQALDPIRRTRHDTEYIPVRHAIYFPRGSHHAVLLAERAGVSGAVTFLGRLLESNFRALHAGLILRLRPAVTGEVMRSLAKGQPIRSLVFTRPRPHDDLGKAMLVAGENVEVEVRVRAPRRKRWGWKALSDTKGEITRENLLGMLAPALDMAGSEEDIARLLDENWQAATEVTMPNGTTRTVNVASSDATTMSFPIEESAPSGDRPTDDDFRASCVATLEMFEPQYGLRKSAISTYTWEATQWSPKDPTKRWKVIWDEPGESTATTP